MRKNFQDEIISSQNILYPVSIAKWEVCKVKDLDKYYAKIYFRKTDDSVKEFSIDVDCYSRSGEKIDAQSNIAVTDINNNDNEIIKIIPLNGAADKLEICIVNCTVDVSKEQKTLIKGIGICELITYIISAVAALFYMFATPFWYGIVPAILLLLLSGGAVGMLVYLLIKKKMNSIMQVILPVIALLFISVFRDILVSLT